MKVLSGLVIGTFVLAAATSVTPATADGHGNKLMKQVEMKVSNKAHAKAITERRMAMRALSGNMKIVAGYLKKGVGGPPEVAAAAAKMESISKSIPGVFPAGTGMAEYEGITGAKPAVFSDAAGFKAAAMKMASLAGDLRKAASAPNAEKGKIAAAFGQVGKMGCGGCHKTYRQKLKK
jgi:cytochrome c556